MSIKKQLFTFFNVSVISLSLSGCGVFDWLIYKPDIPQGNYIETQQVEKLRVEMTKEQVEFILGKPVLHDTFADDTWYYIYHYKSGRDASIIHKELILYFNGNKLERVTGDYELSDQFDIPLEKGALPSLNTLDERVELPENPEPRPDEHRLIEEESPINTNNSQRE